jgi:hypothetical protein
MADTSGPDLVSRTTALLNEIAARMEQPEPIHPAAQQLLGQLAVTLSYLPRLKNAEINVGQAELATRALLSVNPETEFVQTIVDDLERRVAIYKSPLRSIVNGRTPATFVLLGVMAHAAFLAIAILVLSRVFPCDDTAGSVAVCWMQMVIAGAVGGATSLLARLNELAALSRWSSEGDPLQLFYTGLLKPVVGIVAGLFAYAVLSTGLVTVHVPGQGASPAVFYAAFAFLAGFSERFAKDLTDAAVTLPGKE